MCQKMLLRPRLCPGHRCRGSSLCWIHGGASWRGWRKGSGGKGMKDGEKIVEAPPKQCTLCQYMLIRPWCSNAWPTVISHTVIKGPRTQSYGVKSNLTHTSTYGSILSDTGVCVTSLWCCYCCCCPTCRDCVGNFTLTIAFITPFQLRPAWSRNVRGNKLIRYIKIEEYLLDNAVKTIMIKIDKTSSIADVTLRLHQLQLNSGIQNSHL